MTTVSIRPVGPSDEQEDGKQRGHDDRGQQAAVAVHQGLAGSRLSTPSLLLGATDVFVTQGFVAAAFVTTAGRGPAPTDEHAGKEHHEKDKTKNDPNLGRDPL